MGQTCGCENNCGRGSASREGDQDGKQRPPAPQNAAKPTTPLRRDHAENGHGGGSGNRFAELEIDPQDDQEVDEISGASPTKPATGVGQHGDDTDLSPGSLSPIQALREKPAQKEQQASPPPSSRSLKGRSPPRSARKRSAEATQNINVGSLAEQVAKITDAGLNQAIGRLRTEYTGQKGIWESQAITASARGLGTECEQRRILMATFESFFAAAETDPLGATENLNRVTQDRLHFNEAMSKVLDQVKQAAEVCIARRKLRVLLNALHRSDRDVVRQLAPRSFEEVGDFLAACDLKNNKPKTQIRELLDEVAGRP